MNINDFNYDDWTNQWAGNWSTLSFSYFGIIYTKNPFAKNISQYVNQTVILWDQNKSKAYQRTSLKEVFGKELINQIKTNNNLVDTLINNIQRVTDYILLFIDDYIGQDISLRTYLEFQELIAKYYPLHIQLKTMADYFDNNLLNIYFDRLEKTRLYIEPVLSRSEEFMIELAKIHEKKTGYPYDLILAAIADEFEEYLKLEKNKLPAKNILKKRKINIAILFKDGQCKIFDNSTDVALIKKLVERNDESEIIKGTVAYPGKVKGIVRLVPDPSKAPDFAQGDILVTGMTRPEYLLLMKKAGAIVTDAGGVLSHAAITARELKKPTVIATQNATKILKDGDLVEVDAEAGIIKKLN